MNLWRMFLKNVVIQPWFRLVRPMTLGARVVAITPDNQVCLIRHTYTPGWHLPGGGVERGESCKDAALKEAREEAGLIIAPDDLILASIHTNFANFPGDHVTVWHAKAWQLEPVHNPREIAETGFFRVDDLPDGTMPGTRRRIAEATGAPVSQVW